MSAGMGCEGGPCCLLIVGACDACSIEHVGNCWPKAPLRFDGRTRADPRVNQLMAHGRDDGLDPVPEFGVILTSIRNKMDVVRSISGVSEQW
ncbi:hypothetical protein IE81DRAFT_151472 [Ceraceosorus guamensis]|uniref:Uncharacterized protein n=1 Tax=Ceraceosorus guamensis TaxID=1522189 RepID=A0A316VWL9_9BASI|nr:hypothetical protein IE81DRAFT_151472 [Ceraceosorus guamensis]PWN41860.1 hypothetical protein IE81DRAFT_151472 [Ceraceosorus guamensis]